MKRRVISYVSAALLAVMTMAGLSSCIYDYVDEEAAAGKTEDNRFTLYILLGILDGPKSRTEAPKEELMYSIRIVLLDSEGKVEFNEKFSYNEPVIKSGFIQIPTVKGEKQLFFFANEESVTLAGDTPRRLTDLLDAYQTGAEGFEAAVNAAAFSLAPGEPLLMTSRYSLDAGRSGENNYTFYVVPAATKFTFNITNKRVDGVDGTTVIKKIAIASLADINYVMPHVGAQYRNWKNDDGTTTSLYWIDWLQRVVEETNEEPNNTNPDNLEVNRNRGWIFDYELPDNPQHASRTMFDGGPDGQGVSVAGASTNEEGEPVYGTETFGPYYATESIFLNSKGEQEYALQLELTDGTGKEPELSPRSLPFVPALFRNTHVVIDITFEMSYMHVYGEIQSWSENRPAYGWLTEDKD